MKVTWNQDTESCGTQKLCEGLQEVIERGIGDSQSLMDKHKIEEDWGFLLVDASYVFNTMNRHHMLWEVRHEFPDGSLFVFNCYKHWPQLVVRGFNGEMEIILII